jgi:hypothetical protein
MAIELLSRSWEKQLRQRTSKARHFLFACTPFATIEGCELLRSHLSASFRQNGELLLLSDLSPVHLLQASTDPASLKLLLTSVDRGSLRHLPRLHAKVYVFDSDYAIVTSANLTAGGIYRNFEYGLGISDPAMVSRIRDDLQSYADLGAIVEASQLARYCEMAEEVRSRFAEQLRSVNRQARRQFEKSFRETEDELVRLRVRGGRVTPLFRQTILYLLRQHGPLSTADLHPLVQQIHPDLCDDMVDRVIDGVHYGKKWKHWVRTAQHRLKVEGLIALSGTKWHLL